MEYNIPDKLTFKRADVIKIVKVDGKVLDYWENEIGGVAPVINKLGEKFYTRQDLETILKIKDLMIVEKADKAKIKKIISDDSHHASPQEPHKKKKSQEMPTPEKLKIMRRELQEILTILNKNDKI